MKRLSGILGIYLFLLAIVPCVDGEALDVNLNQHDVPQLECNDAGNHDHQNGGADNCSPLCACSCCQTTIRPQGTILGFLNYLVALRMTLPQIQADPHSLIHVDDIWQPPRRG